MDIAEKADIPNTGVGFFCFIHESFPVVIPGLTRNPVFSWIPAFAGMTPSVGIYVVVYKAEWVLLTFRISLYPLSLAFDIMVSRNLYPNVSFPEPANPFSKAPDGGLS